MPTTGTAAEHILEFGEVFPKYGDRPEHGLCSCGWTLVAPTRAEIELRHARHADRQTAHTR